MHKTVAVLRVGDIFVDAYPNIETWVSLIKEYSMTPIFIMYYIAAKQVQQSKKEDIYNGPPAFDYLVHISQGQIAEDLDISISTVRRSIRKLEANDLIEVKRTGIPAKNYYGVIINEIVEFLMDGPQKG